MVLVAADGGLCALLQLRVEGGVVQVLVPEPEGHLVDDVESERVGQFVESRFARIVRRAYVVHRGFLHQLHVAEGQGVADNLHGARVGGVTGDAAQLDGRSVQLQDVALDGQLAEAEAVGEGLQKLAFVEQSCAESVQIGRLGRPEVRFLHSVVAYEASLCVEDVVFHARFAVGMGYLHVHADLAREPGADGQVGEVDVGVGHQGYVAEDSGGGPVVVIVEIAAPKLADYAHGQLLSAGLAVQVGCQVDDGGVVA